MKSKELPKGVTNSTELSDQELLKLLDGDFKKNMLKINKRKEQHEM